MRFSSTNGSNIGLLYWKNVNQLNRNGMDGKNYLTHERALAGAGVRTRQPKTSEVFGRNSTNTIILVSLWCAGNDGDSLPRTQQPPAKLIQNVEHMMNAPRPAFVSHTSCLFRYDSRTRSIVKIKNSTSTGTARSHLCLSVHCRRFDFLVYGSS